MKRSDLILPKSMLVSPERQLVWEEGMRRANEEWQKDLDKWIEEDRLRKLKTLEAARRICLD